MVQFQCEELLLKEVMEDGTSLCRQMIMLDDNASGSSLFNKTLIYEYKCLKMELKNSLFSPIL